MFFPAHLAAGLIVGKLSGDYAPALMGALLIDVDHLTTYARHGILFSPKKFWRAITNPEDPYGDQRNFLHSFITLGFLSVVYFVYSSIFFGIFLFGYATHLLLDLLDGSDFYPLYPLRINFKGPIKYLSSAEFVVTLALFGVFLVI